MNKNYSIFVNSSDGFEDCWSPFFYLFNKQWPSHDASIYLNTEKKNWSDPEVRINCTQVQSASEGTRKLTWSECTLKGLEKIQTPLVLYFQEDYFLEREVNSSLVDELAELMIKEDQIKHIGLTHFGSRGPFQSTQDPRLWIISRKSKYRISTQVGLWRLETLKSYLRPEENGWMFEIFGTARAARRDDLFLTTNREIYSSIKDAIFKYTHTGIIKGKWHPDMPEVFKNYGIEMDFSKRGFFDLDSAWKDKIHTIRRLAGNPIRLIQGLRGL